MMARVNQKPAPQQAKNPITEDFIPQFQLHTCADQSKAGSSISHAGGG
jgi:hypothetical protein